MCKFWTLSTGLGTSAKAILSLVLILASVLACSTCQAQCEAPEPRRAALQFEGIDGVWFRSEVARCLLQDVSQLSLERRQVRLLGEQLELRSNQMNSLQMAYEASEGELHVIIERLEAKTRELERQRVWWRSPWLWLSVGVALGVGGSIAVASAL